MNKTAAIVIGGAVGLGILAFAISRAPAAPQAVIDIVSCAVPSVLEGQDIVIDVALHAPETNTAAAATGVLRADVDGTIQTMPISLQPDEKQVKTFTFPFSVLTEGKFSVKVE